MTPVWMYRLLSAGSFAAAFAIMLFCVYPPQAVEDRIDFWWGFWLFPWLVAFSGLIWTGAWALKRPIPDETVLVATRRYDRVWWLGAAATGLTFLLALLCLEELFGPTAGGHSTILGFVIFGNLVVQDALHPDGHFDSGGFRIRRDVIPWSAVAAYRFDQPGNVLKMLVTADRLPVPDPAIGQSGFQLVTVSSPTLGERRGRFLQQLLAEHLPGRRVGEEDLSAPVIGASRTASSAR